MIKFDSLKSDIKMLFSSMYLCSNCKKEIIRGEGYCDGCSEELLKIEEVGFFKRFKKISLINQIVIVFLFLVVFSIIGSLAILLIWLEFKPL